MKKVLLALITLPLIVFAMATSAQTQNKNKDDDDCWTPRCETVLPKGEWHLEWDKAMALSLSQILTGGTAMIRHLATRSGLWSATAATS